jgi:pyruvate ferredoxin oxidoreductase beta subunit
MNQTKQKFTAATTCAGCPIGIVARTVLNEASGRVVVANATGCMEVTSTIYPNTSWKVPYIHSAFGNAGATISGIETAFNALRKKGKIRGDVKFVAFGGDGGTYDIGLQALSGALERRHDFLYVCYDNGAYMNTGNQRSGATPLGADTETTPFGKKSIGKNIRKKDIMAIVAGHHIPYLATANIGFLQDFQAKVKKAFETKGPKFLLVFSPCVNAWKYSPSQTISVARLATETNFWPLYEIEEGEYEINYTPQKALPVEEFYKTQGRFKHLFGRKDKDEIFQKIQNEIDLEWDRLKKVEKLYSGSS